MKLRLAIAILAVALGTVPAGAQCSMCASSAQAADQQGQRALVRGVAVLMFPTVGFLLALVGVAYRFRNGRDDH